MRKHLTLILVVAFSSLLLAGCFQGEQSLPDIDPPQNAEAVDGSEQSSTTEDENVDGEVESNQTVERQLYLLDSNGLVAPQSIELPVPESKEVATQLLEYLVKDGPVTSLLPNGFQAVLPADTEILGASIEDGTITVDLSEEFKEYQASEEMRILEAMTFTLTQFDNVERVKLRVDGEDLQVMPVDGTPIANGYTRANGINIIESDTVDLINSQTVTMYYPTEHNDTEYFVPVTRYVNVENDDVHLAIVQALIEGPTYETNLMQVFDERTVLLDEPKLNSGVLELVFSQEILKDMENGVISDQVMETIVRTLTEQENIQAVDVKVENVEQIANENGEVYTEPVTRDVFVPSEKL
ncbi:GerMN domain-containing protein [Ornithinibacillus halotolerans]|uniref:Spore germination protein GerM n=1 Tax=Ornithinibacillus halotolerans TaxID=1274357 RepID=A0A916WCN3_9BACI|nr:GerMN domain-containing protein [Ornithinibacillus halotolerans]GGA86109.1 spore germination protein GerM [Ornithinibacillus halotolerans]